MRRSYRDRRILYVPHAIIFISQVVVNHHLLLGGDERRFPIHHNRIQQCRLDLWAKRIASGGDVVGREGFSALAILSRYTNA